MEGMSLDVSLVDHKGDVVHWQNITHNLGRMATEAGLYDALWHPETVAIVHAIELHKHLFDGVVKMIADPATFKQYDSPNGWGTYVTFIPWLLELMEACQKYPSAVVQVSR
jgi:hypothetical protein